MKQSEKRTTYYKYPVELVWRAICGGGTEPQGDTITEEDFETTEPEENTMFTRILEVEQNKRISLRMKTRSFYSDLHIELTATGDCMTRMDLEQSVDYRVKSKGLIPAFRFNLSRETKEFAQQILKRLESSMPKKLK